MKAHKYWAIASVVCMIMAFYTGHKIIGGKKNKDS